MGHYEQLRAEWQGRPATKRELPHVVTARLFRSELRILFDRTLDDRFDEALAALEDCNLIDSDGTWRRGPQNSYPDDQLWNTAPIHEAIAKAISDGRSLRIACAMYVVDHIHSGSSFDAAVKQVERAYRSHLRLRTMPWAVV